MKIVTYTYNSYTLWKPKWTGNFLILVNVDVKLSFLCHLSFDSVSLRIRVTAVSLLNLDV